MIKHSIEWNEILGDMIDEVTQFQENEVRDLMADEVEMTEEVVDDWYATLLDRELEREQRDIWSDFWNDKERN